MPGTNDLLPGPEIYVTWVTSADRADTGRDDFYEFRVPDPVYPDQDDDPIWREHVFRADGSRRMLKRATGRIAFSLARTAARCRWKSGP